MGEGTHTSEMMYGARRSKGRGGKLWAGCITVTNDETLNTGMDHVEGAAFIPVEDTAIDGSTSHVLIKSISGGTITFTAAVIVTAYGASTDVIAYGVVVGRVN